MGRLLIYSLVCLLIVGFTLAPAQTPPPILVSPALGAADIPTSPLFRWIGGDGATSYVLQVSTSPLFADLIVDESGITGNEFTPPILFADGTTYYWRMRSAGPGGLSRWEPQVAGWPFATVTDNVHAPTLISPGPNATDVPTLPTFAWNPAEGATTYQLQLSTSLLFGDLVVDMKDLTGTSFTLSDPLPDETIFFWRVRAFAGSSPSVWSPVAAGRPFKTGAALPAPPALISPAKDAMDVPTQPTFTWSGVPGVVGYQLQVSNSLLFDAPLLDQTVIGATEYTYTGTLANSSMYYWRVCSIGAAGPGLWSPLLTGRPFTTVHGSLSAPVPLSPAKGATDVPVRPTFEWSAVDGATSYDLEITSSQFLGGTEHSKSGIAGTTYQPPAGALNYGILYTWHVRAVNPEGNSAWSEGSEGRTFTTGTKPPIAPLLYLPVDGSPDLPQAIVLAWWNNTEFMSAYFHVQVATDPLFANLVIDRNNVTETETLVNLDIHTTYYWKVLGINQSGSSDWSSVWTFSTGDASLALPTLVSPVTNASNVPLTPTFTWQPTPGATAYDLQVSVSSMFLDLDPAVDQHGLTGTTFKPATPFHKTTRYYWRVRAMNDKDTTLWSPTLTPRAFTTVPPIPPPPRLLSPSYAESAVSLTPTLCWSPAPGATSYAIEIASDYDFGDVIASYCGITDPCFTLPAELSGTTTYFWHVNASNAGGASAFSATWKFSTVNTAPSSPTIVIQPAIAQLVVGQSATLRVSAKGTGPLAYQWLKNADSIAGAVGPMYTTPALGNPDAGSTYRCVISNGIGSVSSDPATVAFVGENPLLLTNGEFESGTEPWALFSNGVATLNDDAAGAAGGKAAHVVISGEGTNVQLYQAGICLEPNTLYKLTLKARANRPTAVAVTLLKNTCPFTSYGLVEDLYLERSWKTFSVEFSTPQFNVPVTDARLMFWLASFDAQGDEYFFDDIVLKKAVLKSEFVSLLKNPGFETYTESWRFYSNGEGTFDNEPPGDGTAHAGHIVVEHAGTNVQLYQADFTLEPYALYRLSFKAASNHGHDLSVWLHQNVPPYDDYGLVNKVFDLTDSWKTYSLLFTTTNFSRTVHDARLRFWLSPYATSGDQYLFDDVSLEKLEASALVRRTPEEATVNMMDESLPTEFSLNANYPNPFNPSTTITYGLPEPAEVTVKVYNLLGQEIATLVKELQPAGRFAVTWDSHNTSVGELSSGMYICRLSAHGVSGSTFASNRKMLLVK